MSLRPLAACVVLAAAAACHASDVAPAAGAPNQESSPMSTPPSSSRPSAPKVAPVVSGGVRYEQDRTDERQGDQSGGYLVATEVASGKRMWRLKVYDIPNSRAAGVESGGIHFRSMRLDQGGKTLTIENETGGVYRVDLAQHTASQIGGPPMTEPPEAAPNKPKPKPKA